MTKAAAREISLTREFDAPPELVYRAFVDPDQFCQWFGPDGFSVPCESVQIDARAGGFQRFVMVSDDDPSFHSRVNATFSEVIENELLVGRQDVEGLPGSRGPLRLRLRLEFHEEPGGRTRLELWQGRLTEQMGRDAGAGWASSFGRLDSLLRRSR